MRCDAAGPTSSICTSSAAAANASEASKATTEKSELPRKRGGAAASSGSDKKRLKLLLAGEAAASRAVQPTREWLVREGSKLSEAATEVVFMSFLSSNQCPATEQSTLSLAEATPLPHCPPTGSPLDTRYRPKRAATGSISGAAKRTKSYILKLISSEKAVLYNV